MTALVFKLHEGASEQRDTTDVLAERLPGWRAAGIVCLGWGRLLGDPEREAELAVDLAFRRFQLDGYCGNAELEYEASTGGVGKSELFVRRYRELAPGMPLACSHLGYGAGPRPFDYAAWVRAGAIMRAQSYTDVDHYPAGSAVDVSVQAGVPLDRIAVDLKAWGGSNPIGADCRDLALAGTVGVGLFRGDTASDDEYRELGRWIDAEGIALT